MMYVARKKQIIDHPKGELKTHTQATPYLGGVGIYISLVITCLLLLPPSLWLMLFLTGAGFLCLTGLIDDIFTLDSKTKFLTQTAGSVTLLISLSSLTGVTPTTPLLIASLFFMFTMVNAINLVDIMDGLAGIICITAVTGSTLLSFLYKSELLTLELTVIGAILGFLWYNKKPAQIYLGDAGSLLLGGVLGFFILQHSWQITFSYDFFIVPCIAGVALIELVYLMIIRTKLGLPFYLGSPHHFAHYLKNKGWDWHSIIGFTFLAGITLNALVLSYAQELISFWFVWVLLIAGLIPWTFIIYKQKNA